MKRAGLGVVASLALAAATGCATNRAISGAEVNTMAPDFEAVDIDGRTVRLSELRGKPVVLAFWFYG